jgi:hypothetical protein
VLRLLFNTDYTMSGKQGTCLFSPVLFTDEECISLIFVIKPFKDKETLRDMIEVRGVTICVLGGYGYCIFVVCVVRVILGVVSERMLLMVASIVSSLIELPVTECDYSRLVQVPGKCSVQRLR